MESFDARVDPLIFGVSFFEVLSVISICTLRLLVSLKDISLVICSINDYDIG